MNQEEIIKSIKWWEERHAEWTNSPQWQMTAPHYGEIVAVIIAAKFRYLEAQKKIMNQESMEENPTQQHSMKCPKLYGQECKCDGYHTFEVIQTLNRLIEETGVL